MPRGIGLRPVGIRSRTTLIAVLVVGVSVSLAMTALVLTARKSLIDQIASNADARAQDIALLAKAGSVPNPIPGRGEDLLVQVLDSRGTVVASSGSIEGQAPLVDVKIAPGASRTFTVGSLLESGEGGGSQGEGGADSGVSYLVAATGVSSPHGPMTVIVTSSLNPVQQMIDVIVPLLALGLPVIMVVVGLTVWTLTGRALRPVEAIRSEAEAISAASLGLRVPEPGTADEIGRLAETMNRMLDRLESSAAAQRRFVSDASHELKSPVAAIRTMVDVARRERPDDFAGFLNDLATEDARLGYLVDDLLVLTRFDEGSGGGDAVEVDVDDVLLGCVASCERSGGVGFDISGIHPVRLIAELRSVESLARNLVENAMRHAATTVWISSSVVDGAAVIIVSDDGAGIAPQDRERVFQRFVRLDESRVRDYGGTGLGLSVCRAVTHSMGGEIVVTEPQHAGATFLVRLPLGTLR